MTARIQKLRKLVIALLKRMGSYVDAEKEAAWKRGQLRMQ
jgi:hypothetical protein